jgi:hypothetical protein
MKNGEEPRRYPEGSIASIDVDDEPETATAEATGESSKNDGSKQADSPEEIVRRENQIITMFRIAVILFLLTAAAATVALVYLYMSRSQKVALLPSTPPFRQR